MKAELLAPPFRRYKEEGTITTPFDMTVLNDRISARGNALRPHDDKELHRHGRYR
jgi:phosphoketolase